MRYLDTLPTIGSKAGHAFRDLDMEEKVLELTRTVGIGAQFGGKYFCHDVRVIRLPRHGASLPVGIGVSCSADRQVLAKITPEGVFLEQLETDPAKYLPETTDEHARRRRRADRPEPPDGGNPRASFAAFRSRPACRSPGTMVVARDIAHAKLKERLDRGEGLPDYLKRPSGLLRRPRQDARRAWRPAASARPPPGGWTATSPSSRPPAARS